jgi:hypothetical protein
MEMSIAETRAFLKAHAAIAVYIYQSWKEIGIQLDQPELVDAVERDLDMKARVQTPSEYFDDIPF